MVVLSGTARGRRGGGQRVLAPAGGEAAERADAHAHALLIVCLREEAESGRAVRVLNLTGRCQLGCVHKHKLLYEVLIE
jgi:hypothetical protein